MRLGLLDVGSTAARLELVDLDRSRLPRANWSFKARTRLAEHTRVDGVVTPDGIDTAARAVQQCVQAGVEQSPHFIVAFGTSAVRDAVNSDEVRERLSKAAGVRIGVLSPHDEAGLSYHAAHRWSGRSGIPLTTVDVGGGTIDVATGMNTYPDDVVSLPIGAARLTRQYLPDDPPRPHQFEELVDATRETVARSMARFAHEDLGNVVALSKLLRQLAVLTASSSKQVVRHPDRLYRAGIKHWIPQLATLDQKGRAALPGVSRTRARRILAGAVVAEALLDTIGADELETCPWGLREGLVFRFVEAYERMTDKERTRGARGDAVRAAMEDMFA